MQGLLGTALTLGLRLTQHHGHCRLLFCSDLGLGGRQRSRQEVGQLSLHLEQQLRSSTASPPLSATPLQSLAGDCLGHLLPLDLVVGSGSGRSLPQHL